MFSDVTKMPYRGVSSYEENSGSIGKEAKPVWRQSC